jgi:Uma2 family endonuclease
MATVILDRDLGEHLRQQRAETGADRWDEVWDGIYMMVPLPNNEHQQIASRLTAICEDTVGWGGGAIVLPGANVSDREQGWAQNYRCPDVVVVLPGGHAKNCGTHWCGGPDFAVEIVSDDDRTRDKIPFYSKIHTLELLLIDRDPWSLELFRLIDSELASIGKLTTESTGTLTSDVLPLSFALLGGNERPVIRVRRRTDNKTWDV